MILLLDNYDSFTYNLYQQIENLGFKTEVIAHDKISVDEVLERDYDKIIISPGPKSPADSGISCDLLQAAFDKMPILGVCLGHQCLAAIFDVEIVQAKEIMHGKTSDIEHVQRSIFQGVKNPMKVARYHSLAIGEVPKGFEVLAYAKDGEIMAMKHKDHPVFGVQFHPESFMTEQGDRLMSNFLNNHF
jgi:anthranilate synthase component 2